MRWDNVRGDRTTLPRPPKTLLTHIHFCKFLFLGINELFIQCEKNIVFSFLQIKFSFIPNKRNYIQN